MEPYIFGIFCIFLLLVFSVTVFISARSHEKKTREQILEQFGQIPEQEDLEFESISKPWKFYRGKEPQQFIDDLTWDDLDMNKVFARLDSCVTSLGEEYLYARLHRSADEKEIDRQERLTKYLDEQPELRLKLQISLKRVGKRSCNGLIAFLNEAEGQSLDHPWIYQAFTYFPLVFLILIPFNYTIAILCILGACCVNILVSYRTRKKIELQMPALTYFSSILWCCRNICRMPGDGLSEFRRNVKEKLATLHGIGGVLSGSVQRTAFANDTQMMAEYFRMITLQDIRSYNKLVRIVTANKETCLALCRELAELDAAIAVLSFRKSLPFYSKPHFIKEMQLNLQDVYHPLLDDPVPNSAVLSGGTLITGSNASGKSTFIKAAAVNGILAAAINTCTARVYQAPKALVITSMAARDNIEAGDSYFIAEIKSMKRVLDHVKEGPCLCFIDEILKGTNTVERIAASAAVLKYLRRQNCICIAASHDMELTQILQNEYENYHFTEQITNNEIRFDYLIKPGPSKSKNALKLLSYTKFDSEIVQDAESYVKKFEGTGLWT